MCKLSLSLIVFFFIFTNCTNDKNPPITIESCVDLGFVMYGDTLNYSVKCYNNSDDKIVVDYVKTQCGCMIAYAKSSVIESGDSTEILITYKPMDFGYTEQNLFVYFYNYEQPVHLMIRCQINGKKEIFKGIGNKEQDGKS